MPVSEHCELVLKQPATRETCLDFRGIRSRVTCGAWQIMEEEKRPFGEAVKSSWGRRKAECAAVGVFSPEPVEPKKAVDLVDPGTGEKKGVITLFEDGAVSVCVEKAPCYVTERPSPEIYYIAQAFYSGMGYGVKPHGGEE